MTSPSIQQRSENINKQPLFPDSHKRLIPVVDPENPVSCIVLIYVLIFEGIPMDHQIIAGCLLKHSEEDPGVHFCINILF